MGHISYPAVVDFGRSKSNATGSSGVGYTIYDKDGNVLSPRTTQNVKQVSPGIYSVSQITFPGASAAHDFFNIVWDTGAAFTKTFYASETLLPSALTEDISVVLDAINALSSSIDNNIAQSLSSLSSSIGGISSSLGAGVSQNLSDLSSSLGTIGGDINQVLNGISIIIPDLSQLLQDVEVIKDFNSGRWRMHNNQMIFYKEDNATEIARFDLFDDSGSPSMEAVFERRKV